MHRSVRIQARYSELRSGPRRGWNRFLRTGTIRFGGKPRDNAYRNRIRCPDLRPGQGARRQTAWISRRHSQSDYCRDLAGRRSVRCLVLATASHLGFYWSEDLDGRKIAAIAHRITREQSKVSDGGVRGNVEIRQRRAPQSSAAAVQQEALPGQEAGFPGQGFALIQSCGQRDIQRFDGGVTDRYFGVNDRIDDQGRALGTLCQRPPRPVAPVRIARGDVQQDVAVHQDATAGPQAGLQGGDSLYHLRRVVARVSPRVSARISSVLMRVSAVPRRTSRARRARTLSPGGRRALRMRAWSPANSNSTLVCGRRPNRLRISCGMVTCPLLVICMVILQPVSVIPQ